jgi:Bacterial Ig-like domain (group 2)
MRTLPRVRASFAGAVVFLLVLGVHAQSQTSASPPAHTQMQPQVLSGARPTVDQALSAGLWRVDRSFQSSIQINNRHIFQHRMVIPVLYMADGTEYYLPTVDVAPNTLATVSINSAIQNAPPQVSSHLSLYGSAAIHFLAPSTGSISAAIQILDVANSLNFVYAFHAPDRMDAEQQTFDGLWWRRDAGVTGFVGLANRTPTSVQVSVQVIGAGGTAIAPQMIALAGHSTRLLSLDDIAATLPRNQSLMGGLHVVFTGKSSDVMISGGLENQSEGYSALIPFVTRDAATSAPGLITLASTGIMVGQPDPTMKFPRGTAFFPYAYLRNASSSALKVDPALYYTLAGGGGQRVALPSLTIAAGSTLQVPVDFGSIGLGSFNGLITETFSTVSTPGDLIVATGSTDQTANYVFEVLPQLVVTTKSQQDDFWRVGGGYDTMITLWNSGTAPEDLLVTFSFAGGKGQYKLPVHLAAGAAKAVDMAEIISEAKPDLDGNLIPPGTNGGGMVVSGPSDLTDDINVILGGGTFSVFGATCNPKCYSCGPLLDGFSIAPTPVQSAVGGTTQMTATVTISTGSKLTETPSTRWSSESTSIASVASGGMVTAVAAGTTTIYGDLSWPDVATTCYPTACQTLLYEGLAPVTNCQFVGSPTEISSNDCTNGTKQTVVFSASTPNGPSPQSCGYIYADSSCSGSADGNVEISSTTCQMYPTPSGTITYFSGPEQSNGNAGSIDFHFTINLNSNSVPLDWTATVVCP